MLKGGRKQGRQKKKWESPGVRQVPEGSGEQRTMAETGCEVICGAPMTLTVKVKHLLQHQHDLY